MISIKLLNKNFFSYTNLINVFVAASLVGLVAIGETYLIIAGLNDLSPGAVAAFSGVLAAILTSNMGLNFGLSLIITVAAAFFEETLRIDPFHLNCRILLEEIGAE